MRNVPAHHGDASLRAHPHPALRVTPQRSVDRAPPHPRHRAPCPRRQWASAGTRAPHDVSVPAVMLLAVMPLAVVSVAGPLTTGPPLPRRREANGGSVRTAVHLGLHTARSTCRTGEPEVRATRPVDTTTGCLEANPTGSEAPATTVETGPRCGGGRAHDIGDKATRIAEHEEHTAALAQPSSDTPGIAGTHACTCGDHEIDTVGHGGQHRRELCRLDSGDAEHTVERNPPLGSRRQAPAGAHVHEPHPGARLRGPGCQGECCGPRGLPLTPHNGPASQSALGEHLGECRVNGEQSVTGEREGTHTIRKALGNCCPNSVQCVLGSQSTFSHVSSVCEHAFVSQGAGRPPECSPTWQQGEREQHGCAR